ncbi:MAG TPA: DUF3659 domain-containing protein [Oculatellaceae cyanobacterium]
MFANKFRTPIAVAALLAGLGLSAQAQTVDYLTGVVRNVIDMNGHVLQGTVTTNGDIVDSNGNIIGRAAVGLIDINGNIIDTSGKTITRIYTTPAGQTTTVVATTPAVFTEPLGAVLDNRRLELEHMINKGEVTGKLTAAQAGEFRASLGRIEAAEIADRASGGVLSYDEAVDVARDLDSLAASVSTASTLNPFAPLIVVDPSGAVRFSVAPNGYIARTAIIPAGTTSQTTVSKTISSDGTTITKTTTTSSMPTMAESIRYCNVLEARRDAIRTMINDGLASGKLSAGQAADLKLQLDAISQAEADAKLSDDLMTYDEALAIGVRLDDLNSRTSTILEMKPLWSMITIDNGVRRLVLEPPVGTTFTQTTTTTSPVYADRIVQTTTTTTAPGTMVTTPAGTAVVTRTAAGNVVSVQTVDPALLITTIDVRRKDLDRMVRESIEKKVISRAQGDLILSDLVRIQQQAVPGITYGRAVLLARDLDVITTQVATVVPAVPQPLIAGSHLTISNGCIVELDDVSVRRSDLEARIAKDYLQGRLTANQSTELRERMNSIETMEATFRSQHPGDLTLKESRILYTNFDKVASTLDKWAGKENQ